MKHMPYGMHEFEDCGFDRKPVFPLANDRVSIHARLDAAAGDARLQWKINGEAQDDVRPEISRRAHDDRQFAVFTLRMPAELSRIEYRICDTCGNSEWFALDTLRECLLDRRDAVRLNSVCAVYQKGDVCLSLLWKQGKLQAYAGKLCGCGETQDGGGDIFCEVKRFTHNKIEILPQVAVRYDAKGLIHEVGVWLRLSGKHVYGLGERFDSVDQQGKKLSLRVEKHFGIQGNNSYLPVPVMMTEDGAGIYGESLRTILAEFSESENGTSATLRHQTEASETAGLLFTLHLLPGTPLQILQQYHALSGRPALPPKWAFGIWISANGWNTQRETMHQLEMCKKHGLPATVIVLEAWSDEKTFYLWNDAQYDMQGGAKCYALKDLRFPADGKWPDPAGMIRAFREEGIRLVLWQLPVIKRAWEGSIPQLDADEEYAIQKGYCILDRNGEPYRVSDGWFGGSLLLDFTNEEARDWWFGKRQYLLDMGVAGFKTDGGEFIFDEDVRLHNGMRGDEANNAYPGQYIAAYGRFGGVTFSRAGYAGAQTTPIHWAGDQFSTWDALRSQVTAGLSAGLSGVPFWSFDLAGFAGPLPSAELYLRALAVAAFCPVMQWHSEPRDGWHDFETDAYGLNDRSPWNMELRTNDRRILAAYRKLTRLRMRLLDELYEEARYAISSSRPLMAHLVVDYPQDANVWELDDEYMLGRNLLIAPVLTENATARSVYLPAGRWKDMFGGREYEGNQRISCDCPVGEALVFARDHHDRLYDIFQEATR